MSRLIILGNRGLISGRLYSRRDQLPIDTIFLSRTQSDPPFGRLELGCPDEFNYSSICHDDTIVLLAGVSNPGECEKHYHYAHEINVRGTVTFAEKSIERGARILFASSDVVFGETRNVVNENSPCSPIGKYGIMKHHVEQHFTSVPSFKSIRVSFVYSNRDKFTSYLADCARDEIQAEVYHPILRNVVYIQDVIDAIVALATKWESISTPVINIGGPELLSRVDLAEKHVRLVWPELTYRSVFPGESFFEARPKIIAMSSPVIESILEMPLHTIEQAVAMEFEEQGEAYP